MFRWIRSFLRSQTQPARTCRSFRPAIEKLESRLTPVVGAFTDLTPIVPGTVFEGVNFDGVVWLNHFDASGQIIATSSGSLLSSGRHVLTAGHCLTNDGGVIDSAYTDVIFHLPGRTETVRVDRAGYRVHPGWNGDESDNNYDDIAILELTELAPLDAPRYELYRGSDERSQIGILAGYGRFGNGDGEDGDVFAIDGMKRFGTNRVDDTVFSTGLSPVSVGRPHHYLVADLD